MAGSHRPDRGPCCSEHYHLFAQHATPTQKPTRTTWRRCERTTTQQPSPSPRRSAPSCCATERPRPSTESPGSARSSTPGQGQGRLQRWRPHRHPPTTATAGSADSSTLGTCLRYQAGHYWNSDYRMVIFTASTSSCDSELPQYWILTGTNSAGTADSSGLGKRRTLMNLQSSGGKAASREGGAVSCIRTIHESNQRPATCTSTV